MDRLGSTLLGSVEAPKLFKPLSAEIGTDGNFAQVFKSPRGREPGWSRAAYLIQLRMDNEGGIWCALGPEISEVMAKITGSEACNTLLAYKYDLYKYISI